MLSEIGYKSAQKVQLTIKVWNLLLVSWNIYVLNFLHSRWIDVDTIFRDDMPQQLAFIYSEQTFLWIKRNPKLSASLKKKLSNGATVSYRNQKTLLDHPNKQQEKHPFHWKKQCPLLAGKWLQRSSVQMAFWHTGRFPRVL